ncbi:type IX secretion/gliding motility protein PorT/SprT [Flavobacterium capsici]|uniref:Porin family protein n=1 Tax=Flavobacterium capsici TaxID=3075618 RepID=A0AA96J570_9FLAO|nr:MULTISPECIES: porin family protein [unclassified Flavobacterium]WNM19999.1 porin family protein [Flavobacterium sp. PMR2A8]WNM21388.1 porin family protein [Flavobacterium sp. PMTSA4]
MKKLFFLSLICLSFQMQAQFGKNLFSKDPIINLENFDKQRVHWGYFLGFSSFDFKTDYKTPNTDIDVKGNTGFNVGLVGNLRLHEYIDLRFEPGLYYASRTLTYKQFDNDRDGLREVKATYINFPLLLKFSSLRTGNVRPYLVGGVSATLNLSSNSKSKDDNLQQKFRVKPWTQNYELGFGVDLYFEYFKFSPSIRGVFGFNDELIRDNDPNSPWTGNIQSMKTRAILINFTFH